MTPADEGNRPAAEAERDLAPGDQPIAGTRSTLTAATDQDLSNTAPPPSVPPNERPVDDLSRMNEDSAQELAQEAQELDGGLRNAFEAGYEHDRDDSLGILASSLESVVRRIAVLEPVVDQGAQDLADLTEALTAITDHIEELYSRVSQQVPVEQEQGEAEPCRWAWRYADDDSAKQLWGELRDFVDWLNSRYSLDSERQVPPCWYRHSIAVEELTALMVSWNNAFYGPNTPRDDLLAWHSYWLWPCLDRLPERAGWQRCKSNGHVARASTIAPTDSEFEEFTTATPPGSDHS